MKLFILNDTSVVGHHGCQRVMDNLLYICARRNVEVIGSYPVGKDWRKSTYARSKMLASDVVIVNGEGTIHHGAKEGQWLIDAARFMANYEIPVFLINATIEDLPDEWFERLVYFSGVFVRESLSARLLELHGVSSQVVPDLTFFRATIAPVSAVRGKGVGCSVSASDRALLIKFASKTGGELMSISFVPEIDDFGKSVLEKIYALKRNGVVKLFFNRILKILSRRPKFKVFALHTEFISELAKLESYITGRFHSVCFCLQAKTPFLALPSNSYKIEGLVYDAGLSNERLVEDSSGLMSGDLKVPPYSKEELKNINSYVEGAEIKINRMFDQIFSV